MKKLMIAACAVALAGAVQAASYSWFDGNYDLMVSGSEEVAVKAGTSVYLFDTATVSQQAVLSAFIAGGIADGYVSVNSTVEGGAFEPVTFSDEKVAGEDSNWQGFYALINADKGEIYISTDQAFAVQKGTTYEVPWADNWDYTTAPAMETSTYAGAGWYAAAAPVPEPTSGLLLLLGVAGLALRRRRA